MNAAPETWDDARLEAACPVTVLPDGEWYVRIRDLRMGFGPREVLRGVDLDVRRGETLVILGLSGSGKTTIFKHLMGVHRLRHGRIEIGPWDLSRMRTADWSALRQTLGVVFQHAALLGSLTVEENVALPLMENLRLPPAEVSRRVRDALYRVFLPAEEILGLRPADLSGGMRKRVGLARALIQQPALILYDEPTTGLDPVTVSGVMELIREQQRSLGVTSIVISHDIAATCGIADRIAMLYRGRIVACGSVAEIRANPHPALQQLLSGSVVGPLTEDFLRRGMRQTGAVPAMPAEGVRP
jgi:phospholipid/cholesterol/gamma-HCH transport system ATP-binding protein